ncbi:hypothetical protein Tco_1163276 [Tanacetum coccineum]
MKAVPPPLSGDYTPLSDHTDLDESQMSYGIKSSTSGDSNSVSNDFVSCDNSDKSSEVNSNDFASSDLSIKTSEPKSNDSTSCASTSSISTSESEAEIESFDFLTKNGYFNKKASNFRKNYSSTSKSCFVCGSYLHLIKDCNYYETQYANDSDGVGYPQRKPIWDNASKVTQSNYFVPQAVPLRFSKVSISAARPNQVSTGRPKLVSTGRPKPVPTDKPKVPEPVPTGRQNRPIPVPTGRVDSPSVTSGWWKSTARPMPYLNRPTSSYFQTYTPYVPQVYSNHMQYGGVRWATVVKPSACCSWKTHRKGLYWVPKNNSGSHTYAWTTFSDPQVEINSPVLSQQRVGLVLSNGLQSHHGVFMEEYEFVHDVSIIFRPQVKTPKHDWMLLVKFIFQSSRYVVPTGRVVVPTGRYVVPAGKVIIIVSPSRLNLVPTGRILSPGKVK